MGQEGSAGASDGARWVPVGPGGSRWVPIRPGGPGGMFIDTYQVLEIVLYNTTCHFVFIDSMSCL